MTEGRVIPAPAPPARLYLLGPFRLEVDGRPVRLPTRKTESLLAYLALHPASGGHSREMLAAHFWGDSPDEDARRSLRGALSALRKALGDACLLAGRDGVGLHPAWPLWVDAQEVAERAAAVLPRADAGLPDLAADLYAADLLPGFADEWVAPERERIRSLYLRALLHVAHASQARADHPSALNSARRALELDPAEEAAHQIIIASHVALGDRRAAVAQCDACAHALREEWGIAPSARTLELCRSARGAVEEASFAPPTTNLPVPLTSFIGRRAEVADIRRLLAGSPPTARLVTITGAGGSGKTRLAIEAAAGLVSVHDGGVWWADLAPLTDETLVPRVVARAVGAPEAPGRSPAAVITERIAGRSALLVLDNCEHLTSACAGLVGDLLAACPGLRILATSRESLGVPGEQVWLAPTLALPDPAAAPDVETVGGCEAIRLFVARAAAQQPGFQLTAQNAADIAAICRRLDGMPLAIELAASRIRVLAPGQIAQRLDRRFALLTGGSRTLLPRQRTLQAAVDWSHDLLTPPERVLFRRLAVFAGGWRLAAAERVCADTPAAADPTIGAESVLDLLDRLVDKSLVLADKTGAEARYGLLETIREYAAARLAEADETRLLHTRHTAFFADYADEGAQQLCGAGQVRWLDLLEVEHDNFRAALRWCLDQAPAEVAYSHTALRLAGALASFWDVRDHFGEGQRWFELVLARLPSAAAADRLGQAYFGAGTMAWRHGEYQRAYDLHALAAGYFQQAGDLPGLARAKQAMAVQLDFQGDPVASEALLNEGLAIARGCHSDSALADGLASLAWLALAEGQLARAAAAAEESAGIYRRLGAEVDLYMPLSVIVDVEIARGHYAAAAARVAETVALARACRNVRFLADALQSQGALQRRQGQPAASVLSYRESLRALRSAPDKYEIARALDGLGLTLAAQGRPDEAARLLGAADGLRQEMGAAMWHVLRDEYETAVAGLRVELGDPALAAAWNVGRSLPLPRAIAYALEIAV